MDKPGLPHNGVPEKTKLRLASKEQVHNNEEVYVVQQGAPFNFFCTMKFMAIPVVEFSREGKKIRKFFG